MVPAASPIRSYRADIDGLRAVAVIAVLLFHAGFGLPGGYVGVDVFFVISGFLITSIVQKEIDRNTFSLVAFWERRFRRLMPALTVVVLSTLAAGWLVLLPHDYQELGQSAVAQALMAANIFYWRDSGYFSGASELKPLLHMWSLAVEEQFYLLLPPLLLLLRHSRRFRHGFLVLIMALSLAWSVYAASYHPSAGFYLLPARAWELLIGVMLALIHGRVQFSRLLSEILGAAGLAAILAACLLFDERTRFPGYAALLPCAGTAVLIATGGSSQPSLASRLLSLRPVVFVGQISYSLYLWHWPLLSFATYLSLGRMSVAMRFALLLLNFVTAILSWMLVEQPFRDRKICKSRAAILAFAAVFMIAVSLLGMGIHRLDGIRSRFPANIVQVADGRRDINPRRRQRNDLPISRIEKLGMPRLGNTRDQRPPVLAVFGDSHCDALMPLLDALCEEFDVPAVGASRAATIPLLCGPTEQDMVKRAFQDAVLNEVKAKSSIRHVLLVARWAHHEPQVMNEVTIQNTIDHLTGLGLKVWIFQQVPEQKTDVPRGLAICEYWHRDFSPFACKLDEYLSEQARIEILFSRAKKPRVSMINPTPQFFASGQTCRIVDNGRPLYVDEDHLSTAGAMHLKPVLFPLFQEIVTQSDITDSRLISLHELRFATESAQQN